MSRTRSNLDDTQAAGPGPAPIVVGIAVLVACVELVLGSAQAFWLCVPAALLAAARCSGRRAAAVSTAIVIGAAYAPLAAQPRLVGKPSPALALLVGLASAAVLTVVRERLESERDALGDSALTDPLTRIANRRLLLAQAEHEIARHRRARQSFALVMLDLDGFKPLNDRFGHAAGDELLQEVAAALSQAMRAQDTVARLGGDEFCVLAPETGIGGTDRLTARVAGAVDSVAAGTQSVSASIGVALFPDDGVKMARLLQVADERLLAVKRGRGEHRRAA
ncbi:MAG: GGDEF domain-containing protein [Solirubrobacteraceae bacterium]